MKTCNVCHDKLNLTEFVSNAQQKDGFARTCRRCQKKQRDIRNAKKEKPASKVYMCKCGLQYAHWTYIRNGTCKICRETKKEMEEVARLREKRPKKIVYDQKVIIENKQIPENADPDRIMTCKCGTQFYAYDYRRTYCSAYCSNQFKKIDSWSRNYKSCRMCGKTENPYRLYGYCTKCYPKTEVAKQKRRKQLQKLREKRNKGQAVAVANV